MDDRGAPARRRPAGIGLATAAVLVHAAHRRASAASVAAAVLLVHTGDGMVRDNPLAHRQVCDGSTTPHVCVNATHPDLLPEAVRVLSGVTGRLKGLQNVPVRFEDLPRRPREDEAELPMLTPLGWWSVRGEVNDPERYARQGAVNLVRPECEEPPSARRVRVTDGAALLTLWAATVPDVFLDPYRRVPLLSLAPPAVSAAIGTSLHVYGRDLDDTAARPWWPRRLAHLLVLTALAAGTPALAVPKDAQVFGAVGMVRNTLGAVGVTALAAVLFGARVAWMPTMLYFSAVYLSAASPRTREATVLAWPVQAGPQLGAWAAALALYVLGPGCTRHVAPAPKDPAADHGAHRAGHGVPGPGVHKSPDRQAEMPSIRAIASSAPYGCRYGSQRGSLCPVPMMRQASPVGGAGLWRRRQPISTRWRSALVWLQRRQDATTLSQAC